MQVFICKDPWEAYINHLIAQNDIDYQLHELEEDLKREARLNPYEPCDGADREYVEVAVAREMRLL